ncbi:MAG: L-threonylcarbamoyladenylate synthase [Dehalococcoidia bacterium]
MDKVEALTLTKEMDDRITEAAGIIKAGGLVAFPTDTVYGLGVNPFNREAVERIYLVKQRPGNLPLPVLLPDRNEVYSVASEISPAALSLMERFWPGGLTIILHKSAGFPDYATAKSVTIAVRVPDHIVPVMLMKKAGVPVIGTSANLSNLPSALTAQEVQKQLGGKVDLIVDGGKCPGGIESTLVDMTGPEPVIIREGAVSGEEINLFLRRG